MTPKTTVWYYEIRSAVRPCLFGGQGDICIECCFNYVNMIIHMDLKMKSTLLQMQRCHLEVVRLCLNTNDK